MANLWDRERNKRTQAKKDKAQKKSRGHAGAGDVFSEDVPLYEIGTIAGVYPKRFEVLKGDDRYVGVLDREMDPERLTDFVIGDRVFFQTGENATDPVLIVGREERRSAITRSRGDWSRTDGHLEEHVLCANVDIGIITVAVQRPEFHPRFVDRYLALLQLGNVTPIICFTKTDLGAIPQEVLEMYAQLQIPVVATSFVRSEGIDALKDAIRGKIAVFLGQSGVGKSSLLQALIPEVAVVTGDVNEKTGKGRHTTTGSSLRAWEADSFIIDTPGIRSLGIDQVPKKEIRFLFPEFEQLETPCRFSDCLHVDEPGCAVKQAVEAHDSTIHPYRYESYRKMMQE